MDGEMSMWHLAIWVWVKFPMLFGDDLMIDYGNVCTYLLLWEYLLNHLILKT